MRTLRVREMNSLAQGPQLVNGREMIRTKVI